MSALPELRQVFDRYPELIGAFGDLFAHAERNLLELTSGTCLVTKEALARQQASLRKRLRASAQSELEELLADQICLCHLEVYSAQIEVVGLRRKQSGASVVVQASEKRLDRAQVRYQASIQKLATVQKLLLPAPSPVDMLRRPVAEKVRPAKPAEVRSRLAEAFAGAFG
jgi:hypothetical protein